MSRESDNEAFVRAYQASRGLKVDGWAGRDTLSSLTRSGDVFDIPEKPNASFALKKPAEFFASLRKPIGVMSQPQVDGFNTLLTALSSWPVSWVAYGLATAWHETAATMRPVKEYGGEAYYKKMYDINGDRPSKARELGNLSPGDGAKYAGRGYVQLTGKTNYEKYGLATRPDDAMMPAEAARVMKGGMERGRFTGKKLADYLPGDYVGARRIINGTDKAGLIAGYARTFEAALKAGEWS